jgi:hypothetical protein
MKNITLNDWEIIFHKTILLYNHLIGNLEHYNKLYRENALEKHFGLQLRIVQKDGKIRYDWIRLRNAKNKNSQWMWYKTFSKYEIKRFYIH